MMGYVRKPQGARLTERRASPRSPAKEQSASKMGMKHKLRENPVGNLNPDLKP